MYQFSRDREEIFPPIETMEQNHTRKLREQAELEKQRQQRENIDSEKEGNAMTQSIANNDLFSSTRLPDVRQTNSQIINAVKEGTKEKEGQERDE